MAFRSFTGMFVIKSWSSQGSKSWGGPVPMLVVPMWFVKLTICKQPNMQALL